MTLYPLARGDVSKTPEDMITTKSLTHVFI